MWMHHLGLSGIIEGGFQILRRHLRALLVISSVVVVPVQVVTIIVNLSVLPRHETFFDGFQTRTGYVQHHSTGALFAAFAVTTLLGLVLRLVVSGALARLVSQVYLGNEAGADESLRYGLQRFWALLGASVLAVLGIAAGFVACILPGIFLGVAWCVTTPALVVEELRAPRALGRSFDLVRKRWWATLGYLFVTSLIVAIPTIVATIVTASIADSRTATGVIAAGVVAGAFSLFVTPLTAAMTVLLYFDLRTRHEGPMYARNWSVPPPPPPPNN
jgi:hypothetical protein